MKVDSRFQSGQVSSQRNSERNGFSDDDKSSGTGKQKRVCCGRGCCSAGAFRKINFDNLASQFGHAQGAKSNHHFGHDEQNSKVV